MTLHIHWYKSIGEVIGPTELGQYGARAWQRFRCRCGAMEDRYEVVPDPPKRRKVT